MIGSLRGIVLERIARGPQSGEVLVEVGGVGYRVIVPAGCLPRLAEPGEPTFLHVHTHVREDAFTLYGFPSRDERQCFEVLIATHGVGPSVALAMLSVHTPAALRRAVAQDDADALMLVPGIGRKTAVRLIVELQSKFEADLDGVDLRVVGSSATTGGAPNGDGTSAGGETDPAVARQEVRAALAGLGYGADEIRHALTRLPGEGSVEEQIRFALRELAVAR
ncbi:MAG TPA: Holliday junction branch migration protein RuvA [Acidimicrobiales bacterium]|nr:Holliday junction branch migration protein RuvA [Acidimicrobiales bacterium]